MNYKRFLGATSAALLIVIAILILAPAAGAASKFRTLYKFKNGKDGSTPNAGLIFDPAGNLYGTAAGGGALGGGVVFELTPNPKGGWKEKVLHQFIGGADGSAPEAGLIFDPAGNVYGTTSWGGANFPSGGYGTVFKLTPNADGRWKERVLFAFCRNIEEGCPSGAMPTAGLIFDPAGNLYGTTTDGDNDTGTAFEMEALPDGNWKEKKLYYFRHSKTENGSSPVAGLVFDQAGNLYGTTQLGGNRNCPGYWFGCGTVFELTPNLDGKWTESVIYAFASSSDGMYPKASLVFDPVGNLYSTTWQGGAYGDGNVFELTPNPGGGWAQSVLYSFTGGNDGSEPAAGLIFDAAGNLYGTTQLGGNLSDCGGSGCGVIFELTPNVDGTWTETVLYSFTDGKDGAYPLAGLIRDQAGNLYGTTSGDGTTTFGSVFEITP